MLQYENASRFMDAISMCKFEECYGQYMKRDGGKFKQKVMNLLLLVLKVENLILERFFMVQMSLPKGKRC